MESFRKGKIINSWGVVYSGLKRQWLTPKQVINYCEEEKITCNKDRLVQLYLALDESLFEFLELIKEFIIEDGEPPITWNEDSNVQDFSFIPKQYWNFWEKEFLLRIISSNNDKETKLHQVAAIHSDFNYPVSWHNFLYYMPPPNDMPLGINKLYDNLLAYISKNI